MREPRQFSQVSLQEFREKCLRQDQNRAIVKNMFNQPVKNEPKILIVLVNYVRSVRSASKFVSIKFNDLRIPGQFFEKISLLIFGRRSFEQGSLCAKLVLARGPIKRGRNFAFPTLIANINSWKYALLYNCVFSFCQ